MTPARSAARDTRAAILAVASELFIDPGYDAASLREIAERLGITKAALYYHFRSKDDILRALLEPMDTVIEELVRQLEAATDVAGFAEVLSWCIDAVFENIAFFRLLERNRHSFAAMHAAFDDAQQHLQMHARITAAVHGVASSQAEEIRMFAALAAVTGFDDWAPQLLAGASADLIRSEMRAAVTAILQL